MLVLFAATSISPSTVKTGDFILAVEGVEDAFLERNYGKEAGELYKPDSMSFGGGRGNGRDFDMEDFDFDADGFEPPEQGNFTPAIFRAARRETAVPDNADGTPPEMPDAAADEEASAAADETGTDAEASADRRNAGPS